MNDLIKCLHRDYNVETTLDDLAEGMKRSRKEQIIEQYHPYEITASKDGRYRTYIKDDSLPSKRKQIVRVNRDDLINFLADYYEAEKVDKKRTIESILDEWLDDKSLECSEPTIKRVRADYKRYYADTDIVKMPIIEITTPFLRKWILKWINDNYPTKHQYNNCTLIIRQVLDYAVNEGYIPVNPWKDVYIKNLKKLMKSECKQPSDKQVYTKTERDLFFSAAWNDYNNKVYPVNQLIPLACMFMFVTGLRIGEVCAVRYDDIDNDVILVNRFVRESGEVVDKLKGEYGDRYVRLIPSAIELIKAAKQRQIDEGVCSDGYIFSMKDEPLFYTSARKAFYKYSKKIGLETPKSSHKARKTFASALIDERININTIREMMGHKDERTTYHNYCFDRAADDEVFNKMVQALS